MPLGIINETHEPPTFYGVDRTVVEKELNANTWWERSHGQYRLSSRGSPDSIWAHWS